MSEAVSIPIASASGLTIRYGTQVVLDQATLTIHEEERVGLVGRNGCGKSTFLRIAAAEMPPDSGVFSRRRELITGYLPQNSDLAPDESVLANVLAGGRAVLDLIAQYERTLAHSPRAAELLHHIEHLDGWNLDQRAQSLLTNLHAPDPDRLCGTLSGGERRRVALCRALLAKPDFLILDEPTNHLDTGSIEWLETFLARYSGSCLFVTHDRYFLDRVATRIVELSRGTFQTYDGNYTDYLIARAERRAVEEMNEHKRQSFLRRELEWVRRAPGARRTKSRDRLDRYFETAAQSAPEAEPDVDLIIPPAAKLANKVIELENLTLTLGERTLFRNLTLKLAPGERLGIVGRNGLGKSSLLRVILGQLAPDEGTVTLGARTEINYVDQDRLALDDNKSVLEEVGEGVDYVKLGEETIGLRSYLRRYLFTDDRANTLIRYLSGGERSRVLLAKILKRGGNVLVLDEPTNDLDLGTLRLLEEALAGFAGSILVVSHDRYFLNRICTSILAFEEDGAVDYHVGNYDNCLERRKALAAAAATYAKPAPAKETRRKAKVRKLSWNETRELEGIEDIIMAAEEESARLNAMFADPEFYQKHGHEWQELEARQQQAKTEVARLYARWEELEAVRAQTEQG